MNTEQEYIAYLNQNPRAREIQFLIHLELSKIKSDDINARKEGWVELAEFLRAISKNESDVEAFCYLQDIQEENVCYIVMQLLVTDVSPKRHSRLNYNDTMSLDEMIYALDIIQGCCIIHHPSKQLVAIELRGLKLFMQKLEELCAIAPQVENSCISLPKSNRSRRSSVYMAKSLKNPILPHDEAKALEISGTFLTCLLDCILSILVDQEFCQIEFRQRGGISIVGKIIENSYWPKEVRAKCAEFLVFLIRYFVNGKDENNQYVIEAFGEDLTTALNNCAMSKEKGLDKYYNFLRVLELRTMY